MSRAFMLSNTKGTPTGNTFENIMIYKRSKYNNQILFTQFQ